MKTIKISTSNKYDIFIGKGIFLDIPSLIMPFSASKKALIVTDDIVDGLYGNTLSGSLENSGYSVKKFVFKNGEESKNIGTLSDILDFALENGFHRNDLFLALGGGVTGDITGLASALFMRGVNVIQIPTTLLSAVDSSVGGKTAVNLKNGKNCVGVFKQPSLVIIDTDIIERLPEDIFNEGMGEVIKCGVIKNLPVFDYINSGTVKDNLEEIITECLMLKKDTVEKDEFDTNGIRNLLNAGHTIAHATELLSGYTVSHGKAVATGLVIESEIAVKIGICNSDTAEKIKKAVKIQNLLFDLNFNKTDLANACLKDKKNKGSMISFILPEAIGKLREIKLSADELIKLL